MIVTTQRAQHILGPFFPLELSSRQALRSAIVFKFQTLAASLREYRYEKIRIYGVNKYIDTNPESRITSAKRSDATLATCGCLHSPQETWLGPFVSQGG